jgi:hypothetical protein
MTFRADIIKAQEKYKGFTIEKSKIDGKYFAYNKITGDKIGGSSKTFLGNTLRELKLKIDKHKQ